VAWTRLSLNVLNSFLTRGAIFRRSCSGGVVVTAAATAAASTPFSREEEAFRLRVSDDCRPVLSLLLVQEPGYRKDGRGMLLLLLLLLSAPAGESRWKGSSEEGAVGVNVSLRWTAAPKPNVVRGETGVAVAVAVVVVVVVDEEAEEEEEEEEEEDAR